VSAPGSERPERRRYFRIDDELALSYRVLEGTEIDAAMARFSSGEDETLALAATFGATSHDMHLALEGFRQDLPEVADYLEGLNRKLDILARLLVAKDSGLPAHPTHAVSLSASGIAFHVRDAVEPGSLLELKLLVFPSHVCVLTLGAVVSCRERTAPGEPHSEASPDADPARYPYRLGVDFSFIRDDDRELLFRHIVRKQGERLRATRDEPGNPRAAR